MELQLARLGRRGLAALAPHSGESILDIGCGGDETAPELVRAVAPDGTVVGGRDATGSAICACDARWT